MRTDTRPCLAKSPMLNMAPPGVRPHTVSGSSRLYRLEHAYDRLLPVGVPDQSARRAAVAQLFRVAAQFASGRGVLTRGRALAALAAVSTDPDLLAQAAAAHAMAQDWYAINAVDLLMDAGAEPGLVRRYVGRFGPTRIVEPPRE